MATSTPPDALAKLLMDLRVRPGSIERIMDGLRLRVVHLDIDLTVDICKNVHQRWYVAIEGKFINEITIRTKSGFGTREDVRVLFLDALGDYVVDVQRRTMKANALSRTIQSFADELIGDHKEAVYL